MSKAVDLAREYIAALRAADELLDKLLDRLDAEPAEGCETDLAEQLAEAAPITSGLEDTTNTLAGSVGFAVALRHGLEDLSRATEIGRAAARATCACPRCKTRRAAEMPS